MIENVSDFIRERTFQIVDWAKKAKEEDELTMGDCCMIYGHHIRQAEKEYILTALNSEYPNSKFIIEVGEMYSSVLKYPKDNILN